MTARPAPAIVWWSTAAFVLLCTAYSLLIPIFLGPDEPAHLDLVLAVEAEHAYPPVTTARHTLRGRQGRLWASAARASVPLERTTAPPRATRPTLDQLAPAGYRDALNHQSQHPPLYYLLAAALPDGDLRVDARIELLRLLSVLLVAPLPWLAWAAARAWTADERLATVSALIPLAVPQLAHIGSVANNDGLLILLAAILCVLLGRVFGGDLSWRTALATGTVTGLALLTKGFALLLLPWVALTYLVASLRHGWGRGVRASLTAGTAAILAGGWWWINNIVATGRLQPRMIRMKVPGNDHPVVGTWLRQSADTFLRTFWGAMAGFRATLPRTVVIGATLIGVLGVILALRRMPSRPDGGRVGSLLLLMPGICLVTFAFGSSWEGYLTYGVPRGGQGRYTFAAIVPLGLCVLRGYGGIVGSGVRRFAMPVLGFVATMQGVALFAMLFSIWGPRGSSPFNRLASVAAWAPWPGPITALIFLALIAAVTGLVVTTARLHLAPEPVPGTIPA